MIYNEKLYFVRMEFLSKISFQKIGFDRILSDSNQYYINLNPIKNNNFE